MTQTTMQATTEATKATIMAVREADKLVNNARPIYTTPTLGGPALKQPTFYWKATKKYQNSGILKER